MFLFENQPKVCHYILLNLVSIMLFPTIFPVKKLWFSGRLAPLDHNVIPVMSMIAKWKGIFQIRFSWKLECVKYSKAIFGVKDIFASLYKLEGTGRI